MPSSFFLVTFGALPQCKPAKLEDALAFGANLVYSVAWGSLLEERHDAGLFAGCVGSVAQDMRRSDQGLVRVGGNPIAYTVVDICAFVEYWDHYVGNYMCHMAARNPKKAS